MKLGLHIPDFTWPAGPSRLGPQLAEVAQAAEEAGFDRLSVMDHVWQIGHIGPPEHEMLEAYTTLGFLAGHTRRISLMTLVTGVVYRSPGLLAKMVSTLDVLSGGRAWLGIGAAWNEQESRGLDLFFPPRPNASNAWKKHCGYACKCGATTTGRSRDSITILPARSTGLSPFPGPTRPSSSAVQARRRRSGWWPATPRRATSSPAPAWRTSSTCSAPTAKQRGARTQRSRRPLGYTFDLGEKGERIGQVIEELRELAALGVQVAHGRAQRVWDLTPLEVIGKEVIPAVAGF